MGEEPVRPSDTRPAAARKPLLQALAGEVLPVPPIWLMRQAGRYLPEYRELRAQAGSFLDLCYAPDLAAEVTFQPIRRFGFDAAILFADILLLPDALGQDVSFVEGEGPVLTPVRTEDAVARLELSRLHDGLAPVYETVSRLAAGLPDEVALIGFAGAPWTVATYMVEGGTSRDHATVRRWALGDPDGFGRLIDLLIEATGQYLIAQVRATAQMGVDRSRHRRPAAGDQLGNKPAQGSGQANDGRIVEQIEQKRLNAVRFVRPAEIEQNDGYPAGMLAHVRRSTRSQHIALNPPPRRGPAAPAQQHAPVAFPARCHDRD